jgi:hypothetical protein
MHTKENRLVDTPEPVKYFINFLFPKHIHGNRRFIICKLARKNKYYARDQPYFDCHKSGKMVIPKKSDVIHL